MLSWANVCEGKFLSSDACLHSFTSANHVLQGMTISFLLAQGAQVMWYQSLLHAQHLRWEGAQKHCFRKVFVFLVPEVHNFLANRLCQTSALALRGRLRNMCTALMLLCLWPESRLIFQKSSCAPHSPGRCSFLVSCLFQECTTDRGQIAHNAFSPFSWS